MNVSQVRPDFVATGNVNTGAMPLYDRRDFMRIGLTGAVGLSLLPGKLFASSPEGVNLNATYKVVPVGNRQRPIVIIWLEGGMSHIDTFSPIPTAPANIRGPYSTIQTTVPGVRISEKLPLTARHADKMAILRNIQHGDHNHSTATSLMFSGSSLVRGNTSQYDSFSVRLGRYLGEANAGYVTFNADPGNPYLYPGIGQQDSLHVRQLQLQNTDAQNALNQGNTPYPSPFGEDFDRARHRGRMGLLGQLNRGALNTPATERWGVLSDRANSILDGDLNTAFDLSKVPARERDKYGRTPFGNSGLIAKRLVQAGAPFILINKVGWDNHSQIKNELDNNLPELDKVISSLFEDLGNRAIIVIGTEFGRTPQINGSNGRDHWPQSSFVVIGGAGVTGRAVGELDNAGFINTRGRDGIYRGELMGPSIARAAGYEFVEERVGVLTTNKLPYYPIF